jgi:hypothetical protein
MMMNPGSNSSGGFEGILHSLRKQTIRELRIGWHDSDHLRGPRCTSALTKAIRNNTSLTHVTIGWRCVHPSCVLRLLKALTKSRARLVSLDLSLDDTIPAGILANLLSSQHHLVEIHIRAVRIFCDDAKMKCPRRNSSSIVEDCILAQYHCLPHWKVLSLIDCNLTDADLCHLADFLHIRGGLAELRLRSNRQITGAGLLMICQAPVMKKLDVSLCDLQPDDALAMANAMKRRPWPLEQLTLAGNYRLGLGALALVQKECLDKILSLDLSYSVHEDSVFCGILTELAQNLNSRSVLQRIAIHGALEWNESAVQSLEGLLERTGGKRRCCSLRSLQLRNPHSPKCLSAIQLQSLEYALRDNYELEDLGLDYPVNDDVKSAATDLQFWLRLNLVGRRIVQHNNSAKTNEEWLQVVEKAGQDSLTVLYWIVRHSADRFGR